MKAIAVTSARRDASAPEVPTVSETLPGFNVLSINGVIATGGTPRELVQRISADFRKLLREPDTAKRLEELGIEPVGNTPEEFGAFIKSEIERWTRVAKAANVKME
jgi:tripartite-type tricarboxylate transporter receptor subunit TctC